MEHGVLVPSNLPHKSDAIRTVSGVGAVRLQDGYSTD